MSIFPLFGGVGRGGQLVCKTTGVSSTLTPTSDKKYVGVPQRPKLNNTGCGTGVERHTNSFLAQRQSTWFTSKGSGFRYSQELQMDGNC